ncbi:EAL domain-containing protein [Euhalothece natronophila Z-M001]|uniref:EAL domain-containing protein n=1 Tax=Euhalothece natronophila Z-M001 TaxID=522448 RepID=A0A5B8NMK9_9CHRO|nr:EAL domain-containing protein [Euhalothece natronophila]QDZ39349.1 EAL domain-containing protein [Euhalothece natronophila Z-M001]
MLNSRWQVATLVMITILVICVGSYKIGLEDWGNSAIAASSEKVKVGVYNNPPKVFMDDTGEAKGFFPELLSEIIEKGNWTLEYVSCHWRECLKQVEAGKLDLMLDVAASPEREERFAFNQEIRLLIATVLGSAITIIILVRKQNKRLRKELEKRQQIENDLRNSEEELKRLIQNVPGGLLRYVIEKDGSHKIPYRSPVVNDIWEFSNNESVDAFWECLHPDDVMEMRESVIESAQSLQPWSQEWRIITPSGKMKWLQATGNPQKEEDGTVFFYTIIIDVTEKKFLEKALQESQEQLQNLTNAIPGAVYQHQVNPEGEEKILFMSEGIKNLFGISPQEMMDNPEVRWKVMSPEARSRIQLSASYSLTTLSPWRDEFEIHLENGENKWIKGEAIPEKMDDGSVVFNGIITDITAQKWQESLLITQQEILEDLAKGKELPKILTELMRLIEQQSQGLTSSFLIVQDGYLYNEGESNLPLGYQEQTNGFFIQEGVGSCGTAVTCGELVISKEIATDPLWEGIKEIPLHYNLQACWSMPILSSTEEVLGTFAVYADTPRSPSFSELHLMEIASKLAKLAIEQKQQEEALQKQAEQEKLLGKVTQEIRQSLDLEAVLNTTVQEVREFLRVDRVIVYNLTENTGKVIAEAVEASWQSLHRKTINDPCLQNIESGNIFSANYPHVIFDVDLDSIAPCSAEMLRGYEVRANLVLPIFQDNEKWGFLIAQQCSAPRQWQQEEVKFLEDLSKQVGIAIQQAQLYQETQNELLKREELATQLRHKAMHDGLTQLPNRSLLMDRLQHTFQRYHRYNMAESSQFALLFLDLNGFKLINDTLGHDAGDQLLIIVADRLRDCLRAMDTVSRLGGDEFVVVLEGITGEKDAIEIANRIQEAFAVPTYICGQKVHPSTSIGIVMAHPDYVYPEEMLRDADIAMYEAKKNNLKYAVFRSSMQTIVAEQLQLENDLREALEKQQLVLYYQPIVDLRSKKIKGLEALMRWKHPDHGIIQPDDFLPIAEKADLLEKMESWGLKEACSQFQAWQKEFRFLKQAAIHFNISLNYFHQNNVVQDVKQILEDFSWTNHSLKLEITEMILMDQEEMAQAILGELEALGVGICLDDFGIGYSSLSYLSQFPIHDLKINNSLIMDLDQGEIGKKNRQIVKAIGNLCNSLKVRAIAEGVETQDQSLILNFYGYDTGQGNYYCHPLPAEKMTAFLKELPADFGC